jgi:short-subunit dehydrogenase
MKKAIVMGASSGIGFALAKLLSENDYKVGITGRRISELEKLRGTKPDCFLISAFDIRDVDILEHKINTLINDLGGLDLLVYCAGTGNINDTLDFNLEKETIDTNIIGFTSSSDITFSFFEKQQFGHLVVISSVAGIRGNRQAPAYNASKAFQINYIEGLRQKACKLKHPIHITDIRPGFVDTAMAKGEGLFWVASVEKASIQILKAIKAKKKVAYITKRWRIIGVILKLMPKFIYDKL